jgi:hypothetical protein
VAKGAFATSCDFVTIVLSSVPVCLVSKKVNKNCGPKMLEDDVEFAFDIEGCYENAVNTGYTDYYGPTPVKKPVKKPIKKTVRRALALE